MRKEIIDGDFCKLGDKLGIYYKQYDGELDGNGVFLYGEEFTHVHVSQLNKDFTDDEIEAIEISQRLIFESL